MPLDSPAQTQAHSVPMPTNASAASMPENTVQLLTANEIYALMRGHNPSTGAVSPIARIPQNAKQQEDIVQESDEASSMQESDEELIFPMDDILGTPDDGPKCA